MAEEKVQPREMPQTTQDFNKRVWAWLHELEERITGHGIKKVEPPTPVVEEVKTEVKK